MKKNYGSVRNMLENQKELKKIIFRVLIVLIFVIGVFLRVYGIDKMPNALNVDEASSGYDAFSIMKYGVDRNGNSFPVVLYAWGSGQSVLYSLMSIPFIAMFGLTEFSMRIAMAIVGAISLIAMYFLIKNIFDNKKLAIIGLAFFAICPWHILKSRWGMDCNLFPDLILFAVLFLILGIKKKKVIWQILSFVMLGISSYSYATSYLFLPIFVGITLGYLIYKKEISIKRAVRIFRNCFCDFVATDCISYYKYF